MKLVKLTNKNYRGTVQRFRREWPKYATQLMNVAQQNSQAFRPKNIGSLIDTFKHMRERKIPGTLSNWEKFYKKTRLITLN